MLINQCLFTSNVPSPILIPHVKRRGSEFSTISMNPEHKTASVSALLDALRVL